MTVCRRCSKPYDPTCPLCKSRCDGTDYLGDTLGDAKPTIRLFRWELESMNDYSHSLPSGQTPGKKWRRSINSKFRPFKPSNWLVGEYGEPAEGYIPVIWYRVVLRVGPRPQHYYRPDWENYERWKREHA